MCEDDKKRKKEQSGSNKGNNEPKEREARSDSHAQDNNSKKKKKSESESEDSDSKNIQNKTSENNCGPHKPGKGKIISSGSCYNEDKTEKLKVVNHSDSDSDGVVKPDTPGKEGKLGSDSDDKSGAEGPPKKKPKSNEKPEKSKKSKKKKSRKAKRNHSVYEGLNYRYQQTSRDVSTIIFRSHFLLRSFTPFCNYCTFYV